MESQGTFPEEKILTTLMQLFIHGGTMTIDCNNGYHGTITLPDPAEEVEP